MVVGNIQYDPSLSLVSRDNKLLRATDRGENVPEIHRRDSGSETQRCQISEKFEQIRRDTGEVEHRFDGQLSIVSS